MKIKYFSFIFTNLNNLFFFLIKFINKLCLSIYNIEDLYFCHVSNGRSYIVHVLFHVTHITWFHKQLLICYHIVIQYNIQFPNSNVKQLYIYTNNVPFVYIMCMHGMLYAHSCAVSSSNSTCPAIISVPNFFTNYRTWQTLFEIQVHN